MILPVKNSGTYDDDEVSQWVRYTLPGRNGF
jgi:hypothetical protein